MCAHGPLVQGQHGHVDTLDETCGSPQDTCQAIHCEGSPVGDVLGSVHGLTMWKQGDEMFEAVHGGWSTELAGVLSNKREAHNLVMNAEAAISQGELAQGTKLFAFTDNMVSKRCHNTCHLKSKFMHTSIVKLHDLVMKGNLFVHFAWISGEQMKKQGVESLS